MFFCEKKTDFVVRTTVGDIEKDFKKFRKNKNSRIYSITLFMIASLI